MVQKSDINATSARQKIVYFSPLFLVGIVTIDVACSFITNVDAFSL